MQSTSVLSRRREIGYWHYHLDIWLLKKRFYIVLLVLIFLFLDMESCQKYSKIQSRLSFIFNSKCLYPDTICLWKHPTAFAAHNWQKWQSRFLTCLCHEIYSEEAVGLKKFQLYLKITNFVNTWNFFGNFVKIWYFVNNCLLKFRI